VELDILTPNTSSRRGANLSTGTNLPLLLPLPIHNEHEVNAYKKGRVRPSICILHIRYWWIVGFGVFKKFCKQILILIRGGLLHEAQCEGQQFSKKTAYCTSWQMTWHETRILLLSSAFIQNIFRGGECSMKSKEKFF